MHPSLSSSATRPRANSLDLERFGFVSLFGALSWGLTALLALFSPLWLVGFWPADFDFWPQSLFLLLLAVAALFRALASEEAPGPSLVCWLVLAFLGWNVVATLFSSYSHDSWLELGRVLAGLGFFFLARSWSHPQQRWGLLGAFVVGLLWPSLGALADFAQTRYPRQAGGFANTNWFATALAMSLPVALAGALAFEKRAWKIIAGVVFGVFLLALAVTSSKGGFVAALAGLLVAVFAIWRANRAEFGRAVRRLWPVLLVGFLVFGFVAARTVGPRLLQTRGTDDNSTQFRVYTWRATVDLIEARPLVGWGPGSFSTAFPAFAQAGYTRTAHQSWLQIAAESGVPALLLLFGAFALALRNGARLRRDSGDTNPTFNSWALGVAVWGALAALLVHGSFDAVWSATPVVVLLSLLLSSVEPQRVAIEERASRLEPRWIGACLLFGIAGYGSSNAAQSEDARRESDAALNPQSPTFNLTRSLQLAREAVALDEGNARSQLQLGDALAANGLNPARSYNAATTLQPRRAGNWRRLAQFREQTSPSEAERAYTRALELDPLNTSLLLERAQWRLDAKNSAGYDDLRAILQLWDAPYGRFPALGEWVNLDFARAVVLLAPQLNNEQLQPLVTRALADIERAKSFQEQNRAILEAVGGDSSLDANRDLPELEAALQRLATESTEDTDG